MEKISLALLVFLALFSVRPAWADSEVQWVTGSISLSKDCATAKASVLSTRDVCASEAVAIVGGVTYLELLKQIAAKTPRKYLGQFYAGEESGPTPSRMSTGDFGYLRVSDSKGLRVAILDRSGGLLALFQIKPALQFLDLVGVAQDRMVSLVPELGLYSARPGRFLFWTSNAHYNAGESFQIHNLIYAGSEQVSIVYDGPFLYSFVQPGPPECNTTQLLEPVKAVASDAQGFPKLAMKVREERRCWKGQREMIGASPDFEAQLYWDKAQQKYLGGSKELLRLNRCRTEGKPNC